MSIVKVMTVFILALYAASPGAAEEGGTGTRLYFEGGILFGNEIDKPDYEDGTYSFMVDAGVETGRGAIAGIDALDRAGLAYNAVVGKSDIRHSFGPRLTWKLGGRWALQNMAGPVFSSEDEVLGAGLHTKNSLVYNDIVSIGLIYEALPVKDAYRDSNGEWIHAYSACLSVLGDAGMAVTLTTVAVILVLGLLFAAGGGGYGGS